MKIHIKHFILTVLALIVCKSYGQNKKTESSSLNSAKAIVPYICDNGGFESGLTYYTFKNNSNNDLIYCNLSTFGVSSYIPLTGANNFIDHVTLVDNNSGVFGGYDPSLFALGVEISRVYEGDFAVKLNDNVNDSMMDRNLTSMSKVFVYSDLEVTYKYSLISERVDGFLDFDRPHFIVRLYNSSNVIVAEECLIVDESNPMFLTTGITSQDFLYTGWKCGSLTVDPEVVKPGDVLTLEFIITDDGKGFAFATVYIDDICNETKTCCEYCININTDVLSGIDNKQAEHCINADNTINTGVMASYHAGYEVILKEDFTALYGSKNRFYIEGCSDTFNSRVAMSQGDTVESNELGNSNAIQIYPNPTNGELNIIVSEVVISSINIMTLDGKTIHVNKQEDESNGSFKLDMSAISQGIYLLTIEKADGTVTTQKIIKN